MWWLPFIYLLLACSAVSHCVKIFHWIRRAPIELYTPDTRFPSYTTPVFSGPASFWLPWRFAKRFVTAGRTRSAANPLGRWGDTGIRQSEHVGYLFKILPFYLPPFYVFVPPPRTSFFHAVCSFIFFEIQPLFMPFVLTFFQIAFHFFNWTFVKRIWVA